MKENKEFTCIRVHNTVKEEYRKLVNVISDYTGSGVYYPLLAEKLKFLREQLEKEIKGVAHTHFKNGKATMLHLEFEEQFNKIYSFNTWDDYGKETMTIPLSKFKQLIITVFNKTHKNTVNMKKEELFNLLELKQIQIGQNWFVVHKKYISNK